MGITVGNDVVLNQVLVRFGDDDGVTDRVIEAVQGSGECWMGGTAWKGRRFMRISVSNWRTTEADAAVVVEVLSPSTRAQDWREKLRQYGGLPSKSRYVIVEPDLRRLEVARWGTDRQLTCSTLGPGDQLPTPYRTWAVDDIYDWVDSVATT